MGRQPWSWMPLLALSACGNMASEPKFAPAPTAEKADMARDEATAGSVPPQAPMAMAPAEGEAVMRSAAPGRRKEAALEPPEDVMKPGGGGEDKGGGERLRTWFPEAFLWMPLVETDASGQAVVPVRVPDQLTTWRVLALGHTRGGAQAGAVYSFDSRLPVYVEPVIPAFLYAGDRVDLPVQMFNTTSETVSSQLLVTAEGALSGRAAGAVSLPGGGTAVQRVSMQATGAGKSTITATLSGADAARRDIPVVPRGRPVVTTRGGTVSSTRAFAITAPDATDWTTQELEVRVFPGPLAVLQSEIERGGGSFSAADAGYGFALANRWDALGGQAGVEVDADAVRRLRLLAWQRVVSHARAPDAGAATDLLVAVRGTTGHSLAEELELRLIRTVVGFQRGDGTWSWTGSGPLQQILVQTALSGRALPEDQAGPRAKAAGALRRFAAKVDDPYTAAVLSASGLADPTMGPALRKLVEDGLVDAGDGRKTIAVPDGAMNPWGWAPSRAEMLAWTVLAAPADAPWRGDLVAELMSGYQADVGFGAGPADVLAIEAVMTALPALDKPVDVVLTVDGREVDREKLDPTQPKRPATLDARGAVGQIGVEISPEVPGLAYVATLRSWVPWTGAERLAGVDVQVEAGPMRVGEDGRLTLTVAAPSGAVVTLEQGLPAGASVDEVALSGLTDRLTEWRVTSDRVRLVTRGFQAGEIMTIPLVVRPAFSGQFTTVPLAVATRGGGNRVEVAPVAWSVAP